ncbi:MAG: hypothetical protein R3A78_05930 [Polyangiales bacterium]|nr:hypothetical protein [Myxococcales bacterium]
MRRSRQRGGVAVSELVLLFAIALGGVAFVSLGGAFERATAGDVRSRAVPSLGAAGTALVDGNVPNRVTPAAPNGVFVSAQAGLGTLLEAGARFSEEGVRVIRRIASEVPAGERRIVTVEGRTFPVGRILSSDGLTELARKFAGVAADSSDVTKSASNWMDVVGRTDTATKQAENWAALVDRALDAVIERGRIPGEGARVEAKGPEVIAGFNGGARPSGTSLWSSHGGPTSLSYRPGVENFLNDNGVWATRGVGGDVDIPLHDAVARLRAAGHRHEPILLDACQTGCDALRPESIARRLANATDSPVIAPTESLWLAYPVDEPWVPRSRVLGNTTVELGYPQASGDWVLVMPDAWGGQVHRGPHPLAP